MASTEPVPRYELKLLEDRVKRLEDADHRRTMKDLDRGLLLYVICLVIFLALFFVVMALVDLHQAID